MELDKLCLRRERSFRHLVPGCDLRVAQVTAAWTSDHYATSLKEGEPTTICAQCNGFTMMPQEEYSKTKVNIKHMPSRSDMPSGSTSARIKLDLKFATA